MKLTVNVSALVFWTMKTVHLGVRATYAPRESETITSSVVVVEGGRTSAVADAVVQPAIRVKAIPILLVTKLVVDAINRVYNILLLWNL